MDDAVVATQPDASVTAAFGNQFAIPLDFKILTDRGPFYLKGLANRLSLEFTFNTYDHVIWSTDTNMICQIKNVALEFDIVTH